MTLTRTFVSWHRRGLPASLTGAPPTGASHAALPATIILRESPRSAAIPVAVAGPGDVAGLDPSEIRRTEPYDGAADFDPSFFPYVELSSPDLPWRFSPVGPITEPLPDPEHPAVAAATRERLQPWLALVVVADEDVTIAPAGPGGLRVITCDGSELPDPTEVWAWAHVQVTTADDEDPAAAVEDPRRAVARLLCPRRLEGATHFLACLVPTFAAGRVDLDPGDRDPLGPAWSLTEPATLPVYFSWQFTTGPEGSFESLARRLRARPAPPGSRGVGIATDAPGWGATGERGATTRMQGALRPLPDPADPADGRSEPPRDPALAAELAKAISTSGTGVELRPPIYGQDYAGGPTAVSADTSGWLIDLNTDVRRRLAAGMAASAVAIDQEELSDRAWQQLAAAGLRPATRSNPQLATELTSALLGRSAAALAGASPALVRMARPGAAGAASGREVAERAAGTAATAGTHFSPTFEEPAYGYLRGISQEWLLPGAGDLADDSVVVLRTNPAFAEAFLVGINHALAHELAWRGYPLEPTATLFPRFWEEGDTETAPLALANWPATSRLGTHGAASDQLALLIRGQLVRRFPTAVLYLSRTLQSGDEERVRPSLSATLEPGTRLFGFPLTPEHALAPAGAGGGWDVVIQEAVDHARFGIDDPTGEGSAAPPSAWQALDWGQPQLRDATHVPVAGPLAGITRPLSSGTSPVAVPTATWGLNAGNLSAIVQQPPFRIRIPVALWTHTGEKS